jgi:hypothetical protein
VVTIRSDRGGEMLKYALRAKQLAKSNSQVRFFGLCDSACTIYLSMPEENLCINRGASFGFHLPYSSSSGANHTAAQYIMKKYPAWVRDWINSKGGLKNRTKRMDYAYASSHIRPCTPLSKPIPLGL